MKLLEILDGCQDDVVLRGRVIIDETFFRVVKSEADLRDAGKKPKGISRNLNAVATRIDNSMQCILLEEGTSKSSLLST